jgi:pyruvate dehydrogenase E2 component (dihydrolipoamide acetyltransferase)
MATRVVMAQLSPTMEEGKLVEWRVDEGAEVAQGDVLAEIETDKANMDVEALGSGVLRKILVPAGTTAPVGTLIGVIAGPDEDISDLLAEAESVSAGGSTQPPEAGDASEGGGESEAGGPSEASEKTEVAERTEAAGAPESSSDAQGPATGTSPRPAAPGEPGADSRTDAPAAPPPPANGDGRLRASPVARRMAHEEGLDLESIAGSGPAGRIVKRDIEAALQAASAEAGVAGAVAVPVAAGAAARAAAGRAGARLEEQVIEHSQMRKAIARRLVESISPVPHFFLTVEIAMDRALALRAELNADLEAGKIGVNDLLLKAAAEALVRHPAVNASWEDDAIRRHGRVDLGIAVALEDGLITPVLRNADRKGLETISVESRELIERARNRKLTPEQYTGATFTISNLGMFEIDEFTAVINPPEAAIMAVGRTEEKPVVVDGRIEVGKRMRVTMSCDHRVIDGAVGAGFLETFKAMLENPLVMLL